MKKKLFVLFLSFVIFSTLAVGKTVNAEGGNLPNSTLDKNVYLNYPGDSMLNYDYMVDMKDTDRDGLSDYEEINKYLTDPLKKDTDGDGIDDGNWEERREYTYSIKATRELDKPFNSASLWDTFEDIRIIKETEDKLVYEVILYPYAKDTVKGNPNWQQYRNDPRFKELLKPRKTTNWDKEMQEQILKSIPNECKTDLDVVKFLVEKYFAYRRLNPSPIKNGAGPIDFYVDLRYEKPLINQYDEFQNGKRDPKMSDQEFIDQMLFAKSMFKNRVSGACTSDATYMVAVLRAAGIPARIIETNSLLNHNYPNEVQLIENLKNGGIKELLKDQGPCYYGHYYLEAYVGGRWIKINNNNRLLESNYIEDYPGIFHIKADTFFDYADTGMSDIWKNGHPKVYPYKLLDLSDSFGVHSKTMPLEEYSVSGTSNIFKGYFKNVDYSNPNAFLKSGEQTKITKEIQDIANEFNNNKDLSTIKEIYQWLNENLKYGNGEKFGRTSAQIINSRMFTGCTDMGLAFVSLTRAKGIPSVFVQTAKIDWINSLVNDSPDSGRITGHILVEVYIGNTWYLVDSTSGKLYLDYDRNNFSLCEGYYIFSKSIEVWDSGAKNERQNHDIMMSIFKKFDCKKYKDPEYHYINLLSGQKLKSEEYNYVYKAVNPISVIIGDRDPVERFASIFVDGRGDKSQMGPNFLNSNTAAHCKNLIILYSPKDFRLYPDFLKKMVPEIITASPNFVMSKTIGERRIVLVKSENDALLLNKINSLPSDILDKDYVINAKDAQYYISSGQVIRINFNRSISPNAVNSNTVYILDANNKKVSCDIATGGKFIFIQPNVNNTSMVYRLVVKKRSGKSIMPISGDFVWKFRVMDEQIPKVILNIK